MVHRKTSKRSKARTMLRLADLLVGHDALTLTCSYSLHMQDIAVASSPADRPLTSRCRLISLVEIALGTFFVIGHNVFHIVPNEVPSDFASLRTSGIDCIRARRSRSQS